MLSAGRTGQLPIMGDWAVAAVTVNRPDARARRVDEKDAMVNIVRLSTGTTITQLLVIMRRTGRNFIDRRLPDGSYLSRIYLSTSDRRNQRKGIVVRVIDYRLKD